MPLGGDPLGPAFEGWTLLAALAAQTQHKDIGLLVTSNRFRPPAMLAKIAATADVVAGGRMVLGIGAGSRPGHPIARREYEAHGLPFHDQATAVAALDEALTIIRRLWTEDAPFDHHGDHYNSGRRLRQPQAAAPHAGRHRRPDQAAAARRRPPRRRLEHPRRRPRRRHRALRVPRRLLRRDRPRPRDHHPLDAPRRRLRDPAATRAADRAGPRRGLHPPHAEHRAALPGRRRALGRRARSCRSVAG